MKNALIWYEKLLVRICQGLILYEEHICPVLILYDEQPFGICPGLVLYKENPFRIFPWFCMNILSVQGWSYMKNYLFLSAQCWLCMKNAIAQSFCMKGSCPFPAKPLHLFCFIAVIWKFSRSLTQAWLWTWRKKHSMLNMHSPTPSATSLIRGNAT